MNWRYRINIKDCLVTKDGEVYDLEDNDQLPEHIREGVVRELKKLKVLDGFRQRLEDKSDISNVEEFNDWLAELYDFCDEAKIWLGLTGVN